MSAGDILSAPRAASVALLLAALAATTLGKPGSRPGTEGDYAMTFYGDLHGTGNAKINPTLLKLTAKLESTTGTGGTLFVKIHLDNGRFSGQGTLGGQPVDVSGRVDGPEGGIVTVARLSIIVRTPDGRVGRGFGELAGKKD